MSNRFFSILKYLSSFVLLITIIVTAYIPLISRATQPDRVEIQTELSKLEISSGGRLGVYAINTGNNSRIQYRTEERFPFCSTGKVMVVSAILKESEKNPTLLKINILYNKEDVKKSRYAPVTEKHLDSGMTVAELCAAAMDYSDNTAMNLLLKEIGGTKEVNAYARSIQDNSFRLDRFEPELNTSIPNDLRDTTTPAAMGKSLYQVALGNSLKSPQRSQLQTWLKNNTSGASRIRAGVPKNWIVGDKTGSGEYGTTNDMGIIWPPACSPIVIVIYFTQNNKDAVKREDVIAESARLVVKELVKNDECLGRHILN